MECTITPKNIDTLCRICLTSSTNLVPLTNKTTDCKGIESIQNMLETVTFTKVVLDDKKFPSKICQMCLSYLKLAHEFQAQFKTSQKLLETITNEAPIKILREHDTQPPAAVELIFGEKKFDLNDVFVVEDEEKGTCTFEGFLRNLGSEISATFNNFADLPTLVKSKNVSLEAVNQNECVSQKNAVIRPKPRKKCEEDYSSLDISRLRVRKSPHECKIVIEEFDENGTTTKIVKTLYECPLCKKVVTSKRDLDVHNDLKHPSHFCLMCEKCGHLAQTQSQFYHHMQKHKQNKFKCDQCDKAYDTISRLKVHLEVHKNQRPYLCNVCGKNFNYAISLTYHLRLHSDKKYVCNICGLKYRMANTLKRHLRTHTKEKPYRCDYCPRRFPSRSEKVSHEMLHTGERPYQCEFCGKGFIKSVNLKMHYLSHPGPHQCQFCHKSFIDVKFLKIHSRVHKDDASD